ncbi:MerR family transcriptional regulator [Rhodococcus chondri]|uniref:MerR family transcriptional regulator n=1 Tax=Rhodococcus chondri TaxID=3065941 RepID=A0ABU7JXG7_9NOCA|nr:MerR family transcriptional regulator [Rhodococcus sp. CC-R104]MEE2034711.1 MerR family transcriptional regulator [Rhodococcus sp. CC-R104]
MQKAGFGQVWKVGQLAAETGLTVRTLHHYDHIGLVQPSGRTASGHRLYEEDDVQRLYQVLALRQLGLSLEVVATVVAGAASLQEVLAAHRQYLDERLIATRRLRAHVVTLSEAARTSANASTADFLELIRGVVMVDDTVKKYFSDLQLADLAERRARSERAAHRSVRRPFVVSGVIHAMPGTNFPRLPLDVSDNLSE